MPLPFSLVENCHVMMAIPPTANGDAIDGPLVSLKNYALGYIVVSIKKGSATEVAISPRASERSEYFGDYLHGGAAWTWINRNTAASDQFESAVLSSHEFSIGNSVAGFKTSGGLTTPHLIVLQVKPEMLGESNDWLAVTVGASHASNIVSAFYLLLGSRYAQKTPLTVQS